MLNLKRIADNIPNFGYLIFASISLLTFVFVFIFNLNQKALDISSLIFFYSSLGLIIKNSNFHKSKFHRFFLLGISVLLIGALFKILHLSYSKEVMLIAFAFFLMSYFLYFLKKKNKNILDSFKLLYVTSLIIFKVIDINHYLYYDEVWIINFFSTIPIIILIYLKYKNTPNWLSD